MPVITRFPATNEIETTGWTNPNNAHADDGSYATAAPAKNGAIGTRWLTFGFDNAIPAGASITTVKIIYEYKVSVNTSIATMRVRARINDVDEENHDDTSEPLVDTVITVDITADRTWTRADLLNAALKITGEARRGNSNTAVTFSLDQIKVEVTYTIASDAGSFSLTGTAATLLFHRRLTADAGAFAWTGTVATLFRRFPLAADSGSFLWTGTIATLLYHRRLTCETGSYAWSGSPASLLRNFRLTASSGSYIWTGSDATLNYIGGGGGAGIREISISISCGIDP